MIRSNCLVEAIRVKIRRGGRLVLITPPTMKGLPWSLLPHIGTEVSPGVVVHFRISHQEDFPLWFRGTHHEDWMGSRG